MPAGLAARACYSLRFQFDVLQLELKQPLQVARVRHEEMRGQHFLNDGANPREREPVLLSSATFHLEKL